MKHQTWALVVCCAVLAVLLAVKTDARHHESTVCVLKPGGPWHGCKK